MTTVRSLGCSDRRSHSLRRAASFRRRPAQAPAPTNSAERRTTDVAGGAPRGPQRLPLPRPRP